MTEFIRAEFDTRDFEKNLKALGDKIARKVVKKALLAGGEVLADAQRTYAPEKTDNIPGGNFSLRERSGLTSRSNSR